MNTLYPIFLKLNQLHVLIVGGGEVGLEKISFMLKSSPDAQITLVAPQILPEIYKVAEAHEKVRLLKRNYLSDDLNGKDLVIAATEKPELNVRIYADARKKHLLINVADTPDLCDFYMGSVVTKGDLKIGISTNGKSPTFAKRFRQVLEEILPDDISALLQNLHEIRNQLKGNFIHKVNELNKITADLVNKA
ncbi:MAG: bifunctional precorrin-2 dehydrogenase/sirohydrochlorin ferrochelatase [Bacteroidia bacterium]|nr:bifunctional precorrin-2 dehydrogenase/sirohydrochlorin ferrochelatase [Bacteroidia bacterium]